MNKRVKTIIVTLFLTAAVSVSVFAQPVDLKNLQQGAADFSENIAKSLAFNSSLGLNWSSAYVGKLFPSLPPHFGVGGVFGFTTMELSAIKTLSRNLGYNIPFDTGKLFLPAYAVEGRIGGLFLPFDIGIKFGYLAPVDIWGTSMQTNYLLVGGDIRYALLDKPVLPKISLGIGVNYLKGGVGAKTKSDITFGYGSDTITLEKPNIGLNWETTALDFKAQIAQSFIIITPYLGVGASYAWSKAGYEAKSKVTGSGGTLDPAAINAYLKGAGVNGMDVSDTGISSIIDNNAFNFRAFGGISFNITVLKIDITGLYSFLDSNYGGSLGIRLQL